jgi:hypothetical protein
MKTTQAAAFQQFLNGLEGQLSDLPFPNQLAFAASCCERAFPNYVCFAKEERWGDPSILRSAIDKTWEVVLGRSYTLTEIKELENRCRMVTPSSDNFPGIDVTAAQEAAFMVTLLLQFCYDNKTSYAVRIATFARDTVDMYIQVHENLAPSDPDLEQKIANHPLMQRELDRQKSDLAALRGLRSAGELRNFSIRAGTITESNIGVKASGGVCM